MNRSKGALLPFCGSSGAKYRPFQGDRPCFFMVRYLGGVSLFSEAILSHFLSFCTTEGVQS